MEEEPDRRQRRSWAVSVAFLLFALVNLVRVHYFIDARNDSIRSKRESLDRKALPNHAPERRRLSRRQKTRILYCVTSVTAQDTGMRATTAGYDRFSNTMIPVLRESIESMLPEYEVDVYLITHYKLKRKQFNLLRRTLPESVGLQVWEEATPLGYAIEHSTEKIQDITRSLSRQHRFVIKDKYFDYDLFVNFEDDMLIKGNHIHQYLKITQQLYTMRLASSDKLQPGMPVKPHRMAKRFYGNMTALQLERMIPGFIRVEVALPGFEPEARNSHPQIPKNYFWNGTIPKSIINASTCCHLSGKTIPEGEEEFIAIKRRKSKKSVAELVPVAPTAPRKPSGRELYYWETGIEVLGVRQLPNHQWFVLQAGNVDRYYEDARFVIGDYWSGNDGYFQEEPPGGGYQGELRPDRQKGRYCNNQGGWMATKRQLIDWHRRWCRGGGFLPPYDPPGYEFDGLDSRSVEYWSGGLQIAGILGCNLQRVIPLDPTKFGEHLLYHTSNNKQRASNVRHRYSGISIQEFWGQLNTVRLNAKRAKEKEIEEKRQRKHTSSVHNPP